MRQIIAAFARNTVFANILTIAALLTGVVSAVTMVREMFPEMNIEVVTVSVMYPGADPEEVEEGICRKIEEAIDGLEGIKKYTTTSQENVGTAAIELIEGYDVSKAKDDIKTRIDAISTFPVDAERPIVNELTFREEVLSLALSGPLEVRTMKEWAERIKDEIRMLPGVTQATVNGTRDYEIAIEVSEERLDRKSVV